MTNKVILWTDEKYKDRWKYVDILDLGYVETYRQLGEVRRLLGRIAYRLQDGDHSDEVLEEIRELLVEVGY